MRKSIRWPRIRDFSGGTSLKIGGAGSLALRLPLPLHCVQGQGLGSGYLAMTRLEAPRIHVRGMPNVRWFFAYAQDAARTLPSRTRVRDVPNARPKLAWAMGEYSVVKVRRPLQEERRRNEYGG